MLPKHFFKMYSTRTPKKSNLERIASEHRPQHLFTGRRNIEMVYFLARFKLWTLNTLINIKTKKLTRTGLVVLSIM